VLNSAIFELDEDTVSLPELLARLTAQKHLNYRRLRRHQQAPLHNFLVQIAAMVVTERKSLPTNAAEWKKALIELVDGDEDGYELIRAPDQPAFLQSVTTDYKDWKSIYSADDQGIAVTSKQFDQKTGSANTANDWAFMLIEHTFQGFSGRGNYGVSRMNGGFGSRPSVAHIPSLNTGERFVRDVNLAAKNRDELIKLGYKKRDGIKFTHLQSWKRAFTRSELDPFFIEDCRRMRLFKNEDKIFARISGTNFSRVSDESNGVVGDLWIPIDNTSDAPKAFTASVAGFSYRKTVDLLNQEKYDRSIAQDVDSDEDIEEYFFHGQVLTRGQGKTDGYHERLMRLPNGDMPQAVSQEADKRVSLVATFQNKVLRPALLALDQNGPNDVDFKSEPSKKRVARYIAQHESAVDSRFFEHLFRYAQTTEKTPERSRFRDFVLSAGEEILEHAIDSSPFSSSRRYRAIAKAQSIFWGSAFNNDFIEKKELDEQ